MLLCVDDLMVFFFFFFQAEDGIRDVAVTGVQTCALPISPCSPTRGWRDRREARAAVEAGQRQPLPRAGRSGRQRGRRGAGNRLPGVLPRLGSRSAAGGARRVPSLRAGAGGGGPGGGDRFAVRRSPAGPGG